MLNIITLLFLTLPFINSGMSTTIKGDYVRKVLLHEQFTTPPEESDVGWTGMHHHFGTEKSGDIAMLRLRGNTIRSDTSWLATSVSLYHGEWNYTINIGGEPSNSNRIDMVVMSDAVDLKSTFNGYIVKAGENGSNDVIRLMRVDNGIMTPILSGTTPIAEGGKFDIRLVRDPIGLWMLYVAKSGQAFQFQGSTIDTKYGNLGYSGFRVIYTRTRNSDYAIGPIQILQTTPQILNTEWTPPTALKLKFDTALRQGSAVALFVDGNHIPTISTLESYNVTFELPYPLEAGRRSLTITGLSTMNGVFSGVEASISIDVLNVIYPRDVLINEYMYHPPEDIPQFVELVNVSSNAINLKGWELRDNGTANRPITAMDLWIEPGGYIVLTPDSSTLSAYYAAPNVRQMAKFPFLNRGSKDAVIVRAPGGMMVDSLGYTPSSAGDGISIERRSLQAPTGVPTNWRPSVHRRGATPGEPNSVPPEDPQTPLLELAIISGPNSLILTFSAEINVDSISDAVINGVRTAISPCTSTDWKLVYCTPPTALPIDPDNPSLIEVLSIRSLLGTTIPNLSSPLSWRSKKGDLIINEILFNPLQARYDGGIDQSQYVELFNVRNHHVFVGDLQLKSKSSSGNSISTIVFSEKDVPIVKPKSMLVLHADTATTASSRLTRYFGLVDDATYMRANRSTLSLNSTSGIVWMYASDLITIDSVRYDATYHYPSVRDRRGVSLERISTLGSSADPTNWGSHAGTFGGSPGVVNSIAVGSQITSESTVNVFPNPFSPDNDGFEDITSVTISMPDSGWLVRVFVHDQYGRKVRTLADGERIGTTHELFWNGLDDNNRRAFTGFYVILVEAWHVERRKSQIYKKVVGLIHQPGAGVSFK
jgi:hypothetical protein